MAERIGGRRGSRSRRGRRAAGELGGASAPLPRARLRVNAREPFHQPGRQAGRQPAGVDASPSPTPWSSVGAGVRTAVRWLGRGLFRHRRALAPIWALLALAALPSIAGRLGLSPLAAPAAGGLLTVIAVVRAGRGHRRVVAGFGVGVSLWAWLALAFGSGPVVTALLLALWSPAAVLWWRRSRIRSRIVIRQYPVRLRPVGEWWHGRDVRRTLAGLRRSWLPQVRAWWDEQRYRRRARKTLSAICNDWRRIASAAEVPGCRVRLAEGDRVAYTLHVDLRRGQPHERMLRHHSMLGSALGADLGTLRIAPEKRMDRVRIRWVHDDPLAGPGVPWPYTRAAEVASAHEAFTLGLNELGEEVLVRLADGVHTFVVGVTDAGKSSVLHVFIASAAGMRDVVLWGIDPAGGVEFELWGPVWDRLASDQGSAAALIAALERVVEARLRVLRHARRPGRGQTTSRVGMRKWDPRLGPYIVVVVDELAQLPPGQRRRLGLLVQLCRKCGIRIVAATQHPGAEDVGSTLRSQLDRVVCLRLQREDDIRMAFGVKPPGWDPTALVEAGSFLIKSKQHREPVPARAYWLDDEALDEAAERLAARRPQLDPESAAAAGAALAADERTGLDEANGGAVQTADESARADRLLQERLPVLLAALRQAEGPVSAREAAKLAGLPHGWTNSRGLRELARLGQARRTEMDRWLAVEAAAGGES